MRLINILIYWKRIIKLNLTVRKGVYFIKLNINDKSSDESDLDPQSILEDTLGQAIINNRNIPNTKEATNG